MNAAESILRRIAEDPHWGGNYLNAEEKKRVAYHEIPNHAEGALGGSFEVIEACVSNFFDANPQILECGIVGQGYEAD